MKEINSGLFGKSIEKAGNANPNIETVKSDKKTTKKPDSYYCSVEDFPSDPEAQAYEYLKSADGQKIISRFGDFFQKNNR